ncbi:MAG TPA: glycosyltransferase, partial [Sphingomicrobium sp.]|nr:glycosyltransferase [Sphingomicrobium sp.]
MVSLARAFASAGRTVDIYVTRAMDGDPGSPAGTKAFALSDDAEPGRWPFVSTRRAYSRALAQALERNPPDLLLAAGSDSPLAIAVRAKTMLPQLLLVVRASSYPGRIIPWRRLRNKLVELVRKRLRRRRYRAASSIIAVSNDVAAGVRRMAPNVPTIVLPSPVVTLKFIEDLAGPPPDHPWLKEKIPVVLAVGRLSVAKDFPTLLRAFQLVRAQREVRLVILGDGPSAYRQELIELAGWLGIQNDIVLQGWTDNVAGWLARAALFVSTSIWEGSPGAIIEALAAGCPVVATDCPGDTRSLLDSGRLGGIAPVGDFRTIAKLIQDQLDKPPDSEELKRAADRYREDSAAAGYLAALDSFLAARINDQ